IFVYLILYFFFFLFNAPSTPEIYTLSLHDALPICRQEAEIISSNRNSLERDAWLILQTQGRHLRALFSHQWPSHSVATGNRCSPVWLRSARVSLHRVN